MFYIAAQTVFVICGKKQGTSVSNQGRQLKIMDKKADRDHHADQMNPNSQAYKERMDHHADQGNPNSAAYKAATDNRANQMNPNNPAYEKSRAGDQSTSKK